MRPSKAEKIESILRFVGDYPESTASLKIAREVLGEAPLNVRLGQLRSLRSELEAAEEWTVDSYYYLVK